MLGLRYECRIETLPAARPRRSARSSRRSSDSGELDDTILVFASDNGTFQGQHRLPAARVWPTTRPRTCRSRSGPAEVRRRHRGHRRRPSRPNIDLAPTFVDWAGRRDCTPRAMPGDGRALAAALLDPSQGDFPPNRPLATELDLDNDGVAPGRGTSCAFEGVRDSATCSSPHLAAGPRDRDVRGDRHARALRPPHRPVRAQNLLADGRRRPSSSSGSRRSPTSSDCAGIEGRDPEPASGHYCRLADHPAVDLVAVELVRLTVERSTPATTKCGIASRSTRSMPLLGRL